MLPDGGSRTKYYWSGENGILYHTETDRDQVNPFFDTVEDAERFLEHQAESHGKDRYEGMVLRKTGNRKVEEAVEVLMDQSGIQDFVPDGGTHQIENPGPDTVWFWYDPSVDYLLQEEVEPYDVRGLFETEDDAHQFLEWYSDRYNHEEIVHLELYSAKLEYRGAGFDRSEKSEDAELPEQASFEQFHDENSER